MEMRMKIGFGLVALCVLMLASAASARGPLLVGAHRRFTLNDPAGVTGQFNYPEIPALAKARLTDSQTEAALDAKRTDPVATHLGESVSFVQPGFDDGAWRSINLPHDWAVE